MAAKNCCYGCQDRVVGCHSTCNQYIEWKAEQDRLKEEFMQVKRKENLIRDSICENIRRMQKTKKSKRN